MNQASLQQLEEKIQQEKNNTIKFALLQELADRMFSQRNFEYALQRYKEALRIARKMSNHKLECDTLIDLGTTAGNLGETERAISFFKDALKIAENMGNTRVQSDILGKLGIAYRIIGKLDLAAEYFNQAADIAHRTKSARVRAIEEQTASRSTSDKSSRSSIQSTTVQNFLEVSKRIKQEKRIYKVQQRITIFVDILFIIILIIISNNVFSHTVSNPDLFFVAGVLVIVAGIILTYLTFIATSRSNKNRRR